MSPDKGATGLQAGAHRRRPAEQGSDRGRQADCASSRAVTSRRRQRTAIGRRSVSTTAGAQGRRQGQEQGQRQRQASRPGRPGVSADGTAASQTRFIQGKSLPTLGFKFLVGVMADPGSMRAWAHCPFGHRATFEPSRFNRQREALPPPIPVWTRQRARDALQRTSLLKFRMQSGNALAKPKREFGEDP